MKKLFGWMLAAVVLISASAAFAAGCGSCPSDKPAAKGACTKAGSCGAFDKVNLTPEQKEKVAALEANCKGVKCPIECKKKMTDGMKNILTAEQFTQWQKACEDASQGGGCPRTGAKK